MDSCRHLHLALIPRPATHKLRCRRCHLTITAEELNGRCCPECHEAHGIQSCEFEEISVPGDGKTRYRCEECGVIIDAD